MSVAIDVKWDSQTLATALSLSHTKGLQGAPHISKVHLCYTFGAIKSREMYVDETSLMRHCSKLCLDPKTCVQVIKGQGQAEILQRSDMLVRIGMCVAVDSSDLVFSDCMTTGTCPASD